MPADVPTAAEFLAHYPEFNGAGAQSATPTAYIDAKLAEAAETTNGEVYQTAQQAKYAVMLRAAVLLLHSPHGVKLRAANPDQAMAWEWRLRGMQRAATQGLRVF